MKNCTHCKHAEWKRTANGGLHPSGDGQCTFRYEIKPLPACMYWINTPSPNVGHINRRKLLKEHCAYWTSQP